MRPFADQERMNVMWLLFVIVVLSLFLLGMGIAWIGNKIYISIKRENREFDQEEREENNHE